VEHNGAALQQIPCTAESVVSTSASTAFALVIFTAGNAEVHVWVFVAALKGAFFV